MRPKKRILLIDTDADRRSTRAYTLYLHAFKVHSARTASEALELFHAEQFDLVICAWPLVNLDGVQLLKELRAANGFIPQLLLAEYLSAPPIGVTADAIMLKGFGTTHLLECARSMSARKRGPRPIGPAAERPAAIFAQYPLDERRRA